jgi:hypothetical protein
VLQRVVARIADVRLWIDDQPRLAPSRQDVLRVEVGGQQDLPIGAPRQQAE